MKITVTNETDLRELIMKDDSTANGALIFLLIPMENAGISRVGFMAAAKPNIKKITLKVEYDGKYVTGCYTANVTHEQYEQLVEKLKKLRDYAFIQTFKMTAPLANEDTAVVLADD